MRGVLLSWDGNHTVSMRTFNPLSFQIGTTMCANEQSEIIVERAKGECRRGKEKDPIVFYVRWIDACVCAHSTATALT